MASRPSFEASTADEALALGRAEHGPEADLHVREIRTGGVGGFFATRRFVAELADDVPGAADGADVSGGLGTVPRAYDSDLDAAIAEASATLGTGIMTTPTRPLTSVAADRDPHASSHTPSQPAPAGAASVPVSPFAAALSRMATEPEVTSAVMDVMDGTTGAAAGTGFAGRAVATVHSSPSRVVLYSVPQAAPVVAGAVEEPVENAVEGNVEGVVEPDGDASPPSLGDFNYAAMLVGGRSPFPGAATPAATPAAVEPGAQVAVTPAAHIEAAGAPVSASASTSPGVPAPAEPIPAVVTALAAAIPHVGDPTGLLPRLEATGFPAHMVPDLFLHEVGEKGIHAALTRLIKMRTAPAPALPVAPCTVVVVGPGTEALTAAMNACGALRADAAQVAWVGPAHLSNLVSPSRRISTPEAATEWLAAPKRATVVNVIAVYAPVSEHIDPHTREVIAALNPTMVLAVVDATRKVNEVTRWVEALDCVDAVALENASETLDPATWLTFAAAPVAMVEGRKATAARWASLLCERLTDLDMEA